MGLKYAVITSVTRDDLPDGGASIFAETIKAAKKRNPGIKIEVLIPDFSGDMQQLETVVRAEPDVLNHNLEVPEAIYSRINRPSDNYRRSLQVLKRAKEMGAVTKSGLMLGLGENEEDILRTSKDLREVSCDLLTIGQYLQAVKNNAPVVKYYSPDKFVLFREKALDAGFKGVVSGPLVRSSYLAHKLYDSVNNLEV
jgi:lipoic acid synthetase